MDRMADVGARRRLSALTVDCYQRWVRDFLRFCRDGNDWKHPRELGATHVQDYLTSLARHRKLSASSQNQATNAIVFLYKQVLAEELGEDHLGRFAAERSKRPARLPTVLSTAEVTRTIDAMDEQSAARLMVELLYGTGMRVMECCTLRLRDLDFDRRQIAIRGGKGDRDRIVMLPAKLIKRLAEQKRRVRSRHERDLKNGGGFVPLPQALKHKCRYARRDWRWQYLFPSAVQRRDGAGRGFRWHADPAALGRVLRTAARSADVCKRVSPHTLRHTFATHLLEQGWDVRQVQQLLGHKSLETTMIYMHVMNRPAVAVRSPLDMLGTMPLGLLTSDG